MQNVKSSKQKIILWYTPSVSFNAQYYKDAIEKLFLIVNKEGKVIPFKLNVPQLQILNSLTGRDYILKARQEGISSLICALFAIDFLTIENSSSVIISHETGATQKLLDKVKFYLDCLKTTFPGELPYKLKYDTKNELSNETNGAKFYIGTAGARAFGRGVTIQNLHVSELSFYQDQERIMLGLLQAVPAEGRIFIETTANGVGNFAHSLWKKAENHDTVFKPHFLPWFLMKEYSHPIHDGFQLDEEEKEIAQKYNLTNEQLNWRRRKIKELNGNIDSFNQEYPLTSQDAFIVSGNPIWSPVMLKKYLLKCKEPKMVGNLVGAIEPFFEENPKGYIKIWQEPVRGHDYVIGVDIAEGLEMNPEGDKQNRTDFSSAYVLDRRTAELVASWHGRLIGDQIGHQLELLGRYYNTAFIGVERNHQGLLPLITLRDLNYPRLYYQEKFAMDSDKQTPKLGWYTDRFTRPLMIDEGSRWLREGRVIIYDEDLVDEMMSFVRYPDGQGRGAQGAYDDRVMSFLITIQMYVRNPFSSSGNDIEKEEDAIQNMLFSTDKDSFTEDSKVDMSFFEK